MKKKSKKRHDVPSALDDLFNNSQHYRETSEYKKFLTFVSRFKQYSLFNHVLVYHQNPGSQYFATVRHWKEKFNRYPKNNSHPMIILAPMSMALTLSVANGGG